MRRRPVQGATKSSIGARTKEKGRTGRPSRYDALADRYDFTSVGDVVLVLFGSPVLLGSGAGEPGAVPGGVFGGDGVGVESLDAAGGVEPVALLDSGDAGVDELDEVDGDDIGDDDVLGAELVTGDVSVFGSGGVVLPHAPSVVTAAAMATQ